MHTGSAKRPPFQPFTLNPQPQSLNVLRFGDIHPPEPPYSLPAPSLNPEPCTLNCGFGTQHPKSESETRNPKPEARNLKPETRNPKPETQNLNPKPETRNPKPETRGGGRDVWRGRGGLKVLPHDNSLQARISHFKSFEGSSFLERVRWNLRFDNGFWAPEMGCTLDVWTKTAGVCGSTSLTKKRTLLGAYRRPMPRLLGGSWGGWRFLVSEVLL